MSKWSVPLLCLIGLGALGWMCTREHVPTIHTQLLGRTNAALTNGGIQFAGPASLSFAENGTTRIAVLRGYKGSPEIGEKAQEIARNVWGVQEVRVEEIPIPEREKVQTEVTEVLKLDIVEFQSGKSTLTPKGTATLDKIGAILARVNDPVEIQGHTDSQGNHDKNVLLSQQRADTTKAYLVTKGIAAERLSTIGYGPDKPVADNATPEGRQRNRRIEFSLKEVVVKK